MKVPGILLSLLMPVSVFAQIPLADGVAYHQDFNGMTAGSPFPNVYQDVVDPPSGWAFTGNGANVGAGAERALGVEQLPPASIGAAFQIVSGGDQVDLEIAFHGEQWYQTHGHLGSFLDFEYSTDATSLTTGTWTQFNAFDYQHTNPVLPLGDQSTDGNHSSFREAKEGTISLTNVPDNTIVWIRWTVIAVQGTGGGVRNNGLAVDDFSITASATGASGSDFRIHAITYDEGSNLVTLTYQSINGEVLGVEGGTDLATFPDELPDTATGDGGLMDYTHNPPVGEARYFYRLLRVNP